MSTHNDPLKIKLTEKQRAERFSPDRVLLNWRELMEAIVYMTEEELLRALQVEVREKKRRDFVERLFAKYNRYRGERELAEYLSKIGV